MNGLDFGTAIGLIKGLGSPDPAVIESAVSDWLDDHPEATTTVQDGSITKAKLDSNLQGTVDDVADLKSQLSKYTGVETVPFVPGGYIATNGAKAYINTIVPSTGYQYLVAECKAGDMVHVTGSGGSTPRLWAFVDADDNVLAKADASLSATDLALTAPEGTKYLVVNDLNSANALVTVGKYVPEIKSEIYNYFNVQSENLFNTATYTDGKYVSPLYGTLIADATMCCTDFIEVKQGDVLTFGNGMPNATVQARFICAFDIEKTVLQPAGSSESVTSYTVPNNVCFVRISFSKSLYANGFFPWISKTGTIKYMPYYSGTVIDLASKNYSKISDITNWPLASFPAYIRNQLSYKPIGTLTKGYVLLTTDDGQAPLATYTLPMLIAKGVPVTMGVMAESQVLNNETYASVFVDAVENHGCSVAAHGVQAYTQYSEYQLNKFFDEQDALIAQFGLTIDGAICPTHAISEMVKAVAGGRYGVVRTATFNGVPSYGGNNYLAGPRSNLYALPSESIIGYDLNYHKTAMDLAKDNHWIRVLYWHDDDLTEQYKTLLEGTIDYALSIGLEFITFKDLANNLII